MGEKSSAPAPDYTGAAQATAASNLNAARAATTANRPTQITPWGTSTWSNNYNQAAAEEAVGRPFPTAASQPAWASTAPAYWAQKLQADQAAWYSEAAAKGISQDNWTQNITLTPDTQASLDSQMQVQKYLSDLAQQYEGRVAEGMKTPFDPNKFGPMPELGFGAVQDIQDAMMARLQPELDRRRAASDTKLSTMGVTMPTTTGAGNGIWGVAQDKLNQGENDASMQALLGAMQSYNDITSRQMQGRQQGFQEEAFTRGLPLQELNAILRGNQVTAPVFNNFATQSTTPGANYLGAAGQQFNADLGNVNASNANTAGITQGLFGLAGAAIGGPAGGLLGSYLGSQVG